MRYCRLTIQHFVAIVFAASLLIIATGNDCQAQSRKALENKKQSVLKQIQVTNSLLEETEQNKKQGYNRLLIIKRRVALRKELISTLRDELNSIDQEIDQKEEIIRKLELELAKLKKEYAKLIYFAYKNRKNYDKLMFILSADDFNQAYRRLKYLQQYNEYRRDQAQKIVNTQKSLTYELAELKEVKSKKRQMLQRKQKEQDYLQDEQQKEIAAIDDLKNKEAQLKADLRRANNIKASLEKEIKALIAKEAEANSFYKNLTNEEVVLSDAFLNARGKLPWPVAEGVIIESFGEHAHPVLKGVKVINEGIDIKVSRNFQVRAIFSGQVKKIFSIPGANTSIILRHGHYLTVYSNLSDVHVKVGDFVKSGTYIGDVFTMRNHEKNAILHLRIYEENKTLNPEQWLIDK
jgi:septal ring factor EnvC (AmiA/AmiB activator)